MNRQSASRLMAAAGIVLAAVAGGALLPGSNPVRAADFVMSAPAAESAPTTRVALTSPRVSVAPPPSTTTTTAATPVAVGAMEIATDAVIPEPALPAIKPAPAQHLTVPAIGIDVDILPVDNQPTGRLNEWGGEIFTPIDFPVDQYARQWVRRGDPNSLPAEDSADHVKAFDRTFLYGHASDIGNHLIFQDLAALQIGDEAIVDTKRGRFIYTVTAVMTSQKVDLDNFAELYDYPADGAKELALVACLPDTTSNVVVLATLTDAQPN